MASPLAALFFSAFVSSTLFPGGSEALLGYLAHVDGRHGLLWLVATAGNTLGGMSSWLLGRWLAGRWPVERLAHKHRLGLARVRHWGAPILLLSWLPVIGDPLCLAAGWLRINPLAAATLIGLGKGARYAVLLWLVGLSG